jgi:hypothetical protein
LQHGHPHSGDWLLRRDAQGRGKRKCRAQAPHEQEVERLKADIEMRDREIDWLKTKRAEDDSLFDIAKTKPDQIARIVLENGGLARSRNIRDGLTQAIDTAERKAREKSMLAG